MPTYNYKCNSCEKAFQAVHSIKTLWTTCPYCEKENIEKTVVAFAASVDTSLESQMRHYDHQSHKDLERFSKDDNFAANVTGQSDLKSEERKQKVIQEHITKQDKARGTIKKKGWNFSNK